MVKAYDQYKVLNKNSRKFVFGIIIILLIISSYWCGIELFKIMTKVQKKEQISFINILAKIIVVYYISIFIHELGHLIAIKLCGYKFKLFMVGPLIVVNDNLKIKMKFKITNVITSGLVIIDTSNSIKCEEELIKFSANFKKISLAGVLNNSILILTGAVLMLFQKTIDLGFLIVVLNLGTIIACTLPTGDISRALIINKKQEDILLYFIEDLVINCKVNDFIEDKIYCYIDNMLHNRKYDVALLNAIIQIIEYNIVNNNAISVEIIQFINWFIYNYNNIKISEDAYIRISSDKLMGLLIDYNIISNETVSELNIKVKYKNLKKHPLYRIYMEFSSYKAKTTILNDRRRDKYIDLIENCTLTK